MGNGFSIPVLAGKRELMKLGGLHHDRERVFLMSLTHGAENHALAQDKKPSQPFRTLFLQETMKRRLLMPSSIVSYGHSERDIETTVERIAEALMVYKKALDEGIGKYLAGASVKPVFRKRN